MLVRRITEINAIARLKEVSLVALLAAFLKDVRALITLGATLIVTDQPVMGRTDSAPGFDILTAEGTTSTSRAS